MNEGLICRMGGEKRTSPKPTGGCNNFTTGGIERLIRLMLQ